MEIFERSQRGLNSSAVDWVVFARGLDREQWRGGYPVSYTHLDVYKRQILYRRHGDLRALAARPQQQRGRLGRLRARPRPRAMARRLSCLLYTSRCV